MFSPDIPAHTHSLRPKRSRQAASDDSLRLPQAKRKRSALRRDTFEPLTDASLNEIAGRNSGETPMNGHVTGSENAVTAFNADPKTLTLRGGKKAEKRQDRTSGALTLSSNEFYNATQLPALPDQIRNQPALPYSTTVSAESGYILASTHTDVLLWSYNSASSSPASRDLLSFKLPFLPSSATDPLPLVAFTARSAAGEPGVVAISSKWGKAVYWETITNASSVVPGQTSSGVQGSIPGLSSGETIKEVVNAEPAGFILTTDHGRVAHLTLRDQVGRPGISIQFLRKSDADGKIYGSIRKVFGSDRRKGTPIVRAGRTTKGQRDVVIGTEDGDFEFWNVNLGAGNSLTRTMTMKDDILEALKHSLLGEAAASLHLRILDFELAGGPTHTQVVRRGENAALPISILAAVSHDSGTTYYILELRINEGVADVRVVHPIKCYTAPMDEPSPWRPRLYLPKPRHIAFVVFDTAIVLFSMARVEESPSSQLLLERNALPDPFQDCIKFQEDTIYRVLGCVAEDHDASDGNISIVLAVQGFGVVRITSIKQQKLLEESDIFDTRISPKSKIEQAVFFGTIRQNPLDLTSSTTGQAFSDDEVSSAALEISSEILASSSKYLPKSTPSIDGQMKLRAKALDDLMHYLLKFHASSLSRSTKFELLRNAEQLAAAQALWKVQEELQRPYRTGHQDRKDDGSYLQYVLRALHESRQTYPDENKGQTDRVRHWLIHDVARIDHLVTEISSCIPELKNSFVTDPQTLVDYHREATDLWNAAYDAAFRFREDNAPTYGLGDELFKNGVLQDGYPEDIPVVWTSRKEPLDFAQHLIYYNCKFLEEWWDYSPAKDQKKRMPRGLEGEQYDAPTKKAMQELVMRLPKEVELFSRLLDEEYFQVAHRLRAQQSDPKTRAEALGYSRKESRQTLRDALQSISQFNMTGAVSLAEDLKDAPLLVTLNMEYIKQLARDAVEHPTKAEANGSKVEDIQNHTETYFDTLGRDWAWAHFGQMVTDCDLGAMLLEAQEQPQKKQQHLTWFLNRCKKQGKPVGKISWINDIIGQRDFFGATEELTAVAQTEESDLWSKRTQLCIAKLAGLAANEVVDEAVQTGRIEASEAPRKKIDPRPYDKALEMLDIQQRVFEHVIVALGQTIDTKAAQDVAREKFASRIVEKSPALKKQLRHALDALIDQHSLSTYQLVDLLTLMDPVQYAGPEDADPDVVNAEFAFALTVIDDAEDLSNTDKDILRRTVWRRAMIRDNWVVLNNTNDKDDVQVEHEMSMSALYRTLMQTFETMGGGSGSESMKLSLFSPQQILDSDPFPESLQRRYKESEVKHIRADLDGEQEKLRGFVEKARLEEHFGGLVTTAEQAVRTLADWRGEEMARELLGDEVMEVGNGDRDGEQFNGAWIGGASTYKD